MLTAAKSHGLVHTTHDTSVWWSPEVWGEDSGPQFIKQLTTLRMKSKIILSTSWIHERPCLLRPRPTESTVGLIYPEAAPLFLMRRLLSWWPHSSSLCCGTVKEHTRWSPVKTHTHITHMDHKHKQPYTLRNTHTCALQQCRKITLYSSEYFYLSAPFCSTTFI